MALHKLEKLETFSTRVRLFYNDSCYHIWPIDGVKHCSNNKIVLYQSRPKVHKNSGSSIIDFYLPAPIGHKPARIFILR